MTVMVDYFSNAVSDLTMDGGVITPVATEPLVNVYCSGALVGTFGGSPDVLGDPDELTCTRTPLTAMGSTNYDVRAGDNAF